MRCGRTRGGLRYAVLRSGTAVGYCALTVGAGTRDEGPFPAGTAHFTEHTVFKGTRRRSAPVINGCLEKLGGELNAFTTKEEIVFHATVLKEDLRKAAGLLLELATEATFPPQAVDTERGVVIDEIVSFKDTPSDDVYDRFEEAFFKGHSLGRLILGSPASVRKITQEALEGFYRSRFTAGRMALTLVSDMDEGRMESLVMQLSDRYFPGSAGAGAPLLRREAPLPSDTTEYVLPAAVPFERVVEKRNHEANAVIGGLAPGLYAGTERRVETILLCNLLGGPASNSVLNSLLRERYGWVYGIECNYTQYADCGVVAVSFGCERANLEKCRRKIGEVLERYRETLISPRRLQAAARQLLGQLFISSTSGEAQALSMGKSLVVFDGVDTLEQTREAVLSVTAEGLRDRAAEIFDPSRLSHLIFL